jgi:hypothetical protein
MANGYSRADLVEFLDYMANKGLGGSSMLAGRKTAVNAFTSVLDADELVDLRKLDLDVVATRLINRRGNEFKPESVRVYRSRVEAAIADLVRYRQDPIAFKPIGAAPPKRPPADKKEKASVSADVSQPASPKFIEPALTSEITFPVPIRPSVVVRLIGIPSDLTRKEAERISAVVLALASNEEK